MSTTTTTETFMEQVAREKREKHARMDTLTRAIAQSLPGWAYTPTDDDEYARYILHREGETDGPRIWIAQDHKTRRINISGCYPWKDNPNGGHTHITPRDLYPRENSPHISVSADKTPEQIARDITRRFLPTYLAVYAKCKQRLQDETDYETRKKNLTAELSALALRAPSQHHPHDFDLPTCGAYGSITVNSPESVDFRIRGIDPEKARKIIEFLKTL